VARPFLRKIKTTSFFFATPSFLLLVVSITLHANTPPTNYVSSKVPGFSFTLPSGWVVTEENFDQDKQDRVGILTFNINPVPLNITQADMDAFPYSKLLLKYGPLPEMTLKIVIGGIGNPDPRSRQESYVAGPINWLEGKNVRQLGQPIATRFAKWSLYLTTVNVETGGPQDMYVIQGQHFGTPFLFVQGLIPSTYGSRVEQFDDGVRQILGSFVIPEQMLPDLPKDVHTGTQEGSFTWWLLLIGGSYYAILFIGIVAIAAAPHVKQIRSHYIEQYRIVAAVVIFYLVYIQLMFIILGTLVAAVWYLTVTISAVANTMRYGSPRYFIQSLAAIILAVGIFTIVVFIAYVIRSQFQSFKRDDNIAIVNEKTHLKLWSLLNSLPQNAKSTSFKNVLLTFAPHLRVDSAFRGDVTLYLGLPILLYLSDEELSTLLTHEAAHNDRGGLLFYRVLRLVITRMNSQSAKFTEAEETLLKSSEVPYLVESTQIDLRAIFSPVFSSAVWLERKLLQGMVRGISQRALTPMMWQFELTCDSRAYRGGREHIYARTLLFVATVQSCWKYADDSKTSGDIKVDLARLYSDGWEKAKNRVGHSLANESPCNGHPPLAQRLAFMGFTRDQHRDILFSIPPPSIKEDRLAFVQNIKDVATNEPRKKFGDPNNLVRIQEAGLLSFDI
jgi:hypothetical protein